MEIINAMVCSNKDKIFVGKTATGYSVYRSSVSSGYEGMKLVFSISNDVANQVREDYESSLIGYHFSHRLCVVVDPWRELQGRDLEDFVEWVLFAYKTYVEDSGNGRGEYVYRRNENYVKVKSNYLKEEK